MSKTKKAAEKSPKRGGLRLLTWIMIGVITVTTFIDVFCIYKLFSKKPSDVLAADNISDEQREISDEVKEESLKAKSIMEKGIISYRSGGVEGTSDIVITGKSDAVDALESVSTEIGLVSPSLEYTVTEVNDGDVFDEYTLQQTRDGLYITGYNLKLTANKRGELVGIVGRHLQLPENFGTSNRLSESEAKNYGEKRMKSELQADPDDYTMRSAGKVIVVDENGDPRVAYTFNIFDPNTNNLLYTIYVDAENGKIIDRVNENRYQRPSFSTSFSRYSRAKDYLYDDIRSIFIYDNYSDKDGYSPAAKENAGAKKLLDYAVKAFDFFDDNYTKRLTEYYITLYSASDRQRGYLRGELVPDELTARYNDQDNDGFAEYASTAAISDNITLNGVSKEYAKAILPFTINDDSVFYIGLSDLFAELIEDYSNGGFNNSCDWVSAPDSKGATRSISDPASTGNTRTLDEAAGSTCGLSAEEQYRDSTLISHTAYRMTQGIGNFEALTTEQLAYLYYNSLGLMPYGMNYEQFRDTIVTAAIELNRASGSSTKLSDSQLMNVIAAFDEAGISGAGTCRIFEKAYSNNAEFTVYDHAYSPYSDYHLTVIRVSDGTAVIDKDCTSSSFTLEGIAPGIYRIIVTDNKNKSIRYTSDDILVSDSSTGDYRSTDRIITKFGALQRSISLVLDVSGSMDGTPMRETKNAAVKFVDYVLTENPSIDISLITYSSSASQNILSSSNRDELVNAIQRMSAYGRTDMYDGIAFGDTALESSQNPRKLMFVMSDGFPNAGPTGNDGSYSTAIIKKANEVKDKGTIIYSLGYFHDYSGAETSVSEAQKLMNDIASPGCAYNIKDTNDLAFVFDELADSVGGSYSIVVRIACPVNVTVKCGGETLSSDPDNLSTRTSFGSLSFEGDNDEIKVLRLNDDTNYELCINGTGEGEMDYSISFADEEGEYSDVRTFKSIPISSDTVIATNTKSSSKTELKVDSDGDGKFDKTYISGKNGVGKEKGKTLKIVLWILAAVIFTGLLIAELCFARRRSMKNKACSKCGAPLSPEMRFCRVCGEEKHRIPVWLPERAPREKQSPTVITAKLVTMGICLLMTLNVVTIYRSAATTVFDQICDQELVSAQMLYDSSVEDSGMQKKYLSMLTKRYIKQVEEKREAGDFSDSAANSIYTTVFEMDMGAASDLAKDYLEKQGIKIEKRSKKDPVPEPTSENFYNFNF
ncbi:MAG: VWA domain-containing protein [Ruminococcus sp.]|nr:VWA domain-containing protein [Ruminococcus sp.]